MRTQAERQRTPWSKDEDSLLLRLIERCGLSSWTEIAERLSEGQFARSGKQCRERYHNHLDLRVNKAAWTEGEEQILFSKQLVLGNRWSDIAKYLPGRTDNCVKNHFYSMLRKFLRKLFKNLVKSKGINAFGKVTPDCLYSLVKKKKLAYYEITQETVIKLLEEQNADNSEGETECDAIEDFPFCLGKSEKVELLAYNEEEMEQWKSVYV